MGEELKTGTTTVGLVLKDAIVLAADSRASMGHLAYDEESKKLYKITDNMALTNAGSVGDSLTIVRFLKSQARLFEMERETKMTVKAAATLLSNVLNSNRYFPYIVQLVIGGINKEAELFELTPDGGLLERKKYAVSGSGTELAMATLDHDYTEGMTQDEGVRLAVKAIKAAKKRDLYSGGAFISVMVLDKNGVKELSKEEVKGFLN